jgi:hypothetical protein
MTKTKRHAKVTLGIALFVAMAHLVGLLGCSKKDESNAKSKSNSYSQLDSKTPVPSAAPSDVEGLAANGMLESRATDQEGEAVGDDGICYRGDKYITIREAYQHPSGWVAFRIETNLAAPFDFVYRPEAYEYCRNKDNLAKWGFEEKDERQLHHFMWQGAMTDDQGTAYLQEPRNKRALIRFDTEDDTKTQWRVCYPDHGFLSKRYATRLTFRTLSNVRNRQPDQSPADYMEWKNDPDKFQMFEITFHVPKATEECQYDIEAGTQAVIETVERQMLLRRIPLLEDPSAIENSFAQFRSWPKGERMRENLAWLRCLAKHGRIEEAKVYLQEYRAYVEEVDQDGKKQFKTVLLPQAERYFERLFGRE